MDGEKNEKITQYGFMGRLVHLRHRGGAYSFDGKVVANEICETSTGIVTRNSRNRSPDSREPDARTRALSQTQSFQFANDAITPNIKFS